MVVYFKTIREELKLVALSSNKKMITEIDIKKDHTGLFRMHQNRIFNFDDQIITGMFFEPNDMCLFLKEESEEDKVLTLYYFSTEENPFNNPQEILQYDILSEPLLLEFLLDYCLVVTYSDVIFFDKEFNIIRRVVNECPNFNSSLIIENTILLTDKQQIRLFTPVTESLKLLSHNKKESNIGMILCD